MAITRSAPTWAVTVVNPDVVASTQSAGSCSVQPGLGVASGTGSSAEATTRPARSIATTPTPLVPTSTPMTTSSSEPIGVIPTLLPPGRGRSGRHAYRRLVGDRLEPQAQHGEPHEHPGELQCL